MKSFLLFVIFLVVHIRMQNIRRRLHYQRPPFMEKLPPGYPFCVRSSSLPLPLLMSDAGAGAGAGDGGGDFRRRRRELLRLDSDVSFTGSVCLFVIVSFVIALFVFLVAASPWGVSPPSLGGGGGGGRRR